MLGILQESCALSKLPRQLSEARKAFGCFTFTELGTVIHTLVVILVLCAEGCVVVVPEGVTPCVAGVVPHKQTVAV